MNLLHVTNCGVYREAQKKLGRSWVRWINLTVSGLKKCDTCFPDGTPAYSLPPGNRHLSLGFPDFRSDFEYGPDRENWVLMFELPELQYDPEAHRLFLQQEEERIPLMGVVDLSGEECLELRETFVRITRLSQSALSSDHLQADLLAASLLQLFFLRKERADTPAELLREALDKDRAHRFTIREHCRKLQLNPDYLRRVFTAAFGVSPGEYRIRRRKNDLLSLFTYSTLSFKEIADRLGLKHVQHLNLLTKQYFQCTPCELNRRCRKVPVMIEANPVR